MKNLFKETKGIFKRPVRTGMVTGAALLVLAASTMLGGCGWKGTAVRGPVLSPVAPLENRIVGKTETSPFIKRVEKELCDIVREGGHPVIVLTREDVLKAASAIEKKAPFWASWFGAGYYLMRDKIMQAGRESIAKNGFWVGKDVSDTEAIENFKSAPLAFGQIFLVNSFTDYSVTMGKVGAVVLDLDGKDARDISGSVEQLDFLKCFLGPRADLFAETRLGSKSMRERLNAALIVHEFVHTQDRLLRKEYADYNAGSSFVNGKLTINGLDGIDPEVIAKAEAKADLGGIKTDYKINGDLDLAEALLHLRALSSFFSGHSIYATHFDIGKFIAEKTKGSFHYPYVELKNRANAQESIEKIATADDPLFVGRDEDNKFRTIYRLHKKKAFDGNPDAKAMVESLVMGMGYFERVLPGCAEKHVGLKAPYLEEFLRDTKSAQFVSEERGSLKSVASTKTNSPQRKAKGPSCKL